MRIVARQKTISKMTVNRHVHLFTAKAKDSSSVKEKFNPNWNGILSVDGKYVKVYDSVLRKTVNYCWICGIDFPTKDLPHYLLHDEEGRIDMVIYFKELKRLGYPLKVLISDDNHEILEAARFVYGNDFQFQLCTFHYMRKLESFIHPAKNYFLVESIRGIIHSRKPESFYRRLTFLFDNKHCFLKGPLQRKIFADFQEHLEHLATHIYSSEYIPNTSNEIENLFRQLNLRLKTIPRFNKYRYASDFLNAWALMRRFTPFTDCKKPNKHRNGKAPLELAGVDISGIDYLKL
jgi:transposase-like protein